MATLDLWPDEILTEVQLEGPTALLQEQAALLGQKTKNLVEAEVKTVRYNSVESAFAFTDFFTLFSPSLNYRYSLFHINYSFEFFPAYVIWENSQSQIRTDEGLPAEAINSTEELAVVLHEIFSHPKTVRIIRTLLSRSRS